MVGDRDDGGLVNVPAECMGFGGLDRIRQSYFKTMAHSYCVVGIQDQDLHRKRGGSDPTVKAVAQVIRTIDES